MKDFDGLLVAFLFHLQMKIDELNKKEKEDTRYPHEYRLIYWKLVTSNYNRLGTLFYCKFRNKEYKKIKVWYIVGINGGVYTRTNLEEKMKYFGNLTDENLLDKFAKTYLVLTDNERRF